ncbi:MAG: hypothetical protein C0404_03640 [Verrucomicrobia bacterium]|nr:hypothetical protein [Verrucomicrobiota bacterium]
MKRSIKFLCLAAVLWSAGRVVSLPGAEVRVSAEKLNVRAWDSDAANIVGVVQRGVVLTAGEERGDWIQIVPTEGMGLFVFGELVRDGAVAVSKAPARSGAGINYKPVTMLAQGDRISVRGTSGEWLKIAPPKGTYFWVNKKHTTPVATQAADPVATQKTPAGGSAAVVQDKPPAVPAIPPAVDPVAPRDNLARRTQPAVPVEPAVNITQRNVQPPRDPGNAGNQVLSGTRYEGVIREAGFFSGYPSKYHLVKYDSKGRIDTTWYADGSGIKIDLKGMVGKAVVVYGEEKTVQGVKDPVLVIKGIMAKDQ